MIGADDRFKLVCYVCDNSHTIDHNGDGTMTYHQVFLIRPDTCRYAVMQDLTTHKFVSVDLYHTTLVRAPSENLGTFTYDTKPRSYDSEDVAVVATLLSYED
jgi:hypothetical protein